MKNIHYIGLDIGTTNSSLCLTHYDEATMRFVEPEAVRLGENQTTRSILLLDGDGRQAIEFGEKVYTSPDFTRHPERVQEEFKPRIGQDPRAVHDVQLLCGRLLEKLQRFFNLTNLPQPDEFFTTVGVPVHWATQETERAELVRRAVEAAGFPSVEYVAEPIGAMLYHAYLGDILFEFRSQHWLVIDFGGGTIDLAVVETAPGGEQPHVIATFGKTFGGKDFDHLLYEKLIAAQYGQDLSLSPMQQIEVLNWIRRFKERFSEAVSNGRDSYSERLKVANIRKEVSLSRQEFESEDLARSLIRDFRSILIEAFSSKKQDVALQDIDRVILTGGSARWYFVREIVESVWRSGVVRSANPELTIAKGLALASTGFQIPSQQITPAAIAHPGGTGNAPSQQAIQTMLRSASVIPVTKLNLTNCYRRADKLVIKAALAGTVVGVLPIPGLTHLPLTALEAKLVSDISEIYGYKLQGSQVATIIASLLAGSMLIRVGVTEALAFLPTIGWVIKGGVAGTAIKLLGEAAIKYFEEQRRRELNISTSTTP